MSSSLRNERSMLVGLQSRKHIHPFDLLRPQIREDGCAGAAPHRRTAFMAGGLDLIDRIKNGEAFDHLIGLEGITALQGIWFRGGAPRRLERRSRQHVPSARAHDPPLFRRRRPAIHRPRRVQAALRRASAAGHAEHLPDAVLGGARSQRRRRDRMGLRAPAGSRSDPRLSPQTVASLNRFEGDAGILLGAPPYGDAVAAPAAAAPLG
jgi:hypothetical protein